MEDWAVEALAEAGFDAELEIASVSRTGAHIKELHLRRDGQEYLAIETLRADYVWPDVRDRKIKRLEIEGVTAQLNLNETWRPVEGWINDLLPNEARPSAKKKTDIPFPENGVSLKDAALTLTSPLGEAVLYIDSDIPNAKNFTTEIILAPSDLAYGGYAAKGAGVVSLEKNESDIRIIGQTQAATLSNENLAVTQAHLQLDGTYNLDARAYKGGVSLDSDAFSSDVFASGPIHLGWDGDLSLKEEKTALGTWTVRAENGRAAHTARAAEVAEKLSLYSALGKVPVTEHYAPHIKDTVLDFLTGSDVAGQGRFTYNSDGFTVNPVGPFSVTSPLNQINLHPKKGQDFYVFDKTSKRISAQMDAAFEQPVNLTLTDIHLKAASNNGVSLNGVKNFSAGLSTQSDWRVTGTAGRPARLGPLDASFTYDATRNPRRISVNTALDYDGELPGGYVEGLTLEGRTDARLYKARQVMDFTPKPDSLVTLKSLETTTAWRGENISFTLPPTQDLFISAAERKVLAATVNTARFTLTRPAAQNTKTGNAQRLDLQAATMKLDGTLFPDTTKDWAVEFGEVKYASETLPGPETTGYAAQASLTARLTANNPPQITLNSPSITAETPQARFSDIAMSLRGTPDAYEIEHNGGMIAVIGTEFAETAKAAGVATFPANGTLTFADETFSGRANLRVAKANNAEVNVDYTYQDGGGTLDIDVPSILFDPKGLQPQNLFPASRGKVARVDGEASAKLNIAFSDGEITSSGGTVQFIDMAVGTAPGPITGLNSAMHFTSLFPLETSGKQTLTMKSFNPGFPLENGVVSFNFVPEGVEVDAADWPIGNGSFSLDPFTWVYTADENRVTMRVKDVALGDFLNDLGNKKIDATGTVVGVFPIVVRGVEVLIEDGVVSVPNGGVIKYDPGPNSRTYSEAEAIDVLRQRRSNEYAALAQDALREFRYRELSASLNGPLNGDVEIGLIFDGSNEKVLNRQPFRFDITVKGELFNIARSFNSNAQVKAEIMRQNGALPEGAVIGE